MIKKIVKISTILFLAVVIGACGNYSIGNVVGNIIKPPVRIYNSDGIYYRELKKHARKKEVISLKEVFDFDWDAFYIVSDPQLSGKELSTAAGINVDELYPFDPHSPKRRIIFALDNGLAYDYHYDCGYMFFSPRDEWIAAEDAIAELSLDWNDIYISIGNEHSEAE